MIGEGFSPEITNHENLVFGKTYYKDKVPKLYLIDNDVILVTIG